MRSPIAVDRRLSINWPLTAAVSGLIVLLSIDPTKVRLQLDDPIRLILLAALAAVGGAVIWTRGLPWIRQPESTLLLASFVWTILASPFGREPGQGVVVALALAATAVIGLSVGEALGWLWFLRLLAPVLLFLLVGAIVADFATNDTGRWDGWSEEPNPLAILAALSVVVAVTGLMRGERWHVVLLMFGGLMLVMTEARVPVIATAVGSIVAARPKLGRGTPLFLIAAGALLGAAFIASGALGSGLLSSDQVEDVTTLHGRTDVWAVVIDGIEQNPVTGIGLDATQAFLADEVERVSWGPTHAHSAPLQMALQGGLPAAALFTAASVAYWVTARRRPVASRDAIVLALVLIGLTEHLVRDPSVPLLVLAVAFGSIRSSPPDAHNPSQRTLRRFLGGKDRRGLSRVSH